jgi:hypothetical protein
VEHIAESDIHYAVHEGTEFDLRCVHGLEVSHDAAVELRVDPGWDHGGVKAQIIGMLTA